MDAHSRIGRRSSVLLERIFAAWRSVGRNSAWSPGRGFGSAWPWGLVGRRTPFEWKRIDVQDWGDRSTPR